MRKRIKKELSILTSKLPTHLFIMLYNTISSLGIYKSRISFCKKSSAIIIQDSQMKIMTFSKRRAFLYAEGIQARLDTLAKRYMIDSIDYDPNDIMIDCGSNIGELGIWFLQRGGKYIAIDPDPVPLELSKYNLKNRNTEIINKCLWHQNQQLKLFLKTESADSSAIYFGESHAGTVEVDAITLDSLIESLDSQKIKLLKVEAEGAEPEVLKGLNDKAHLISYIAVDAGYERGIKKENTIPEVTNQLFEIGFKLRKAGPKYLLFERKQ